MYVLLLIAYVFIADINGRVLAVCPCVSVVVHILVFRPYFKANYLLELGNIDNKKTNNNWVLFIYRVF